MRRSEAIELLSQVVINPEEVLRHIEAHSIYPLRYQSNGCLCGHFDICSCPPGKYIQEWDSEGAYAGPAYKKPTREEASGTYPKILASLKRRIRRK